MTQSNIDINSTYAEDTQLWWDNDKQCYTAQSAPIHNSNPSVHDLVIMDLIASLHGGNELLCKELWSRKAIGLAEYGTPLQAFNGRDCEKDAIEEMADMICYLKQGIMEGKDYLQDVYWRAIALAVDTINLRAVHSDDSKIFLESTSFSDVPYDSYYH